MEKKELLLGKARRDAKSLNEKIEALVSTGKVTSEDVDALTEYAKEVGIDEFKCKAMIFSACKEEIRKVVKLFFADGEISESELAVLVAKVDGLGIDKTELEIIINEESNRKLMKSKRKESQEAWRSKLFQVSSNFAEQAEKNGVSIQNFLPKVGADGKLGLASGLSDPNSLSKTASMVTSVLMDLLKPKQ